MNSGRTISILGAGSFGTAMAACLARSGYRVLLYCRTAEQARTIAETGENPAYFPGHRLDRSIAATNDLGQAFAAEIIFLAFPAGRMDAYVALLGEAAPQAVIVNLVKGLHDEAFAFATLFEQKLAGLPYVALKGPTFARPVFFGEWCGFTCGTASPEARRHIEALFAASPVHLDFCASAAAVDAVSAIKNVYAIVLGLAASIGLSENTQFLLVSLIIKEMRAILDGLDHGLEALFAYCGLGDMLLTGLCDTSRNRTLGFMLGKGIAIDSARSGFLAEGVRATSILLRRVGSPRTPLLNALRAILDHECPPTAILAECLSRS